MSQTPARWSGEGSHSSAANLTELAGLLALSGPAAAAGPAGPPQALPADVGQAREILEDLVETNTTHQHGSTGLAQAIARRLLQSGCSPSAVQLLIPPDHPAKGNVVVRLRGRSAPLKPVLFIGHLDVVEARPEDWSTDPFKLVEKDGYLYGRGRLDMKGGDADGPAWQLASNATPWMPVSR